MSSPPRSFMVTKSLVSCLRPSVTNGLAIAFLMTASGRCLHVCTLQQIWGAMLGMRCRCTALFPNQPTGSTHHWCPPLIRGDAAELMLSCQADSRTRCAVSPPDKVSAPWLADDFTAWLSNAWMFLRVSFQTQTVHLRDVSRT